MDSEELNSILNTSLSWHCFSEEEVKKAPSEKGIYVIRMANGKSHWASFWRIRYIVYWC